MRRSLLLSSSIFLSVYAHEPEASAPFSPSGSEEEFSGHFHTGWESRYFSEGRDALDGDTLWVGSVEFGWQNFTSGVWYGRSPDQDYDELQLNVAFAESIGDFEFYAGLTHLRTPFDGLDDNEVGAGFGWTGLPHEIELTADAYYSFGVEGSFWEFALNRSWLVSDEFSLQLSGIFGVNQGYVSDGHDGANHFALRLGSEYALTESVAITMHVAQSWALKRDSSLAGDELLIDFFHVSLGLQFSF